VSDITGLIEYTTTNEVAILNVGKEFQTSDIILQSGLKLLAECMRLVVHSMLYDIHSSFGVSKMNIIFKSCKFMPNLENSSLKKIYDFISYKMFLIAYKNYNLMVQVTRMRLLYIMSLCILKHL